MNSGRRASHKRDVRLRAIAITLSLVLLSGTGLYLLPGKSGEDKSEDLRQATATEFRPDAEFDRKFREAALKLHRKEYREALAMWEQLVKQAPTLPEAWVNLGYSLLGLNRHEDAQQVFQRALSLRSSQLNAYYGLALALEGQDKYADAAFNMQAYLERTSPDDPYIKPAREQIRQWMEWEAERQSCEPAAPTSLELVDNQSKTVGTNEASKQ